MVFRFPSAPRAFPSKLALHSQPPAGYRFGTVEVDFQNAELRRSGLRIKIQDQPMQVLAILLRHPGAIVTREEFRTLLWSADTFVDFDHGLNSAMKRLRDALDDDPEHPRLIETIPRHGYRFIAPVTQIATAPADGDGPEPEKSKITGGRWTNAAPSLAELPDRDASSRLARVRRWSLALMLAVVVIGGTLVVGIYRGPNLEPQASAAPHVFLAVVPLNDITGDSSHEVMAAGITQELITQLGNLSPPGTIVKASSSGGPSARESVAAIGSHLHVAYVLEGSTRLQGKHLRVSAQLIKVSDQSYVWAGSYDITVDDVLRVQQQIAGEIARAVHNKLAG